MRYHIILGLIMVFISSCSKHKNYESTEAAEMAAPMSDESGAADPAQGNKIEVVNRKIIKNGNIQFETSDIIATRKAIGKIVADAKGYVAQDNSTNYDNKTEVRIQIRIPAGSFDVVMNKVSEKADLIESKNVTTQDVTAEFIDIEARIRTKKELENRYKSLLNKANTVTEILTIEKELGVLRAEIESIEGRMKFLSDNVDFSTLDIVFHERTGSEFGFGSKFKAAIGDGWQNVLAFMIGLISLWPFILILAAIYFLIKRARKNSGSKLK